MALAAAAAAPSSEARGARWASPPPSALRSPPSALRPFALPPSGPSGTRHGAVGAARAAPLNPGAEAAARAARGAPCLPVSERPARPRGGWQGAGGSASGHRFPQATQGRKWVSSTKLLSPARASRPVPSRPVPSCLVSCRLVSSPPDPSHPTRPACSFQGPFFLPALGRWARTRATCVLGQPAPFLYRLSGSLGALLLLLITISHCYDGSHDPH